MDQNTQTQSFSIDPDMVAALDPSAIRNIALHYALKNKHDEAWRLMVASKKLEDLWRVIHMIEHCAEYYNLNSAQAEDVILEFAPLIGKQLAFQNHTSVESPEKLSHINIWFRQTTKFIRSMADAAGDDEIIKAFCNNLPSGIQWKDSHAWKEFNEAFTAIPGLFEQAIKACALQPTRPTYPVRHGSPGLLLATSRGSLPEFKRCLAALESIGVDPALCVAQMWPDKDQRNLEPPYNANCALTDAMAAGSLEISKHIISINPALSLMAEAKRIAAICDSLAPAGANTPESGFEAIKAQALSIAEALTLNATVQSPSSKIKTKPL